MYSKETVENGGRDGWKEGSGLGDESPTRIDLETRGFGEWSEGDGQKGDPSTRGEMGATRGKWESLVE